MSGIKKDIYRYQQAPIDFDTLLNNDTNLQLAIHLADEAFELPAKIKMLHLNDVFSYDLPIWNSSPGLPWKDCGFKTKGEVVKSPHNCKMIRWFWHSVKHNKNVKSSDCCAFVRSHLTQGDDKVRAVWGYPLNMVMGEAVFAVPLIEAYKEFGPLAYGYETAVGGMKRILRETAQYKYFAAIDFKNFDKTVIRQLVRLAFKILMRNINFVHYRTHGVADAVRMMRMWLFIEDYFINTPIRTCDGSRYQKTSGIASGSYFTQLIDSIVNYILITWMFLDQHGEPPRYLKVMGDDSIAAADQPIDLDQAADLFEKVGMVLNIQKSGVTTDINRLKFLGFEVNYGWPLKSFDEWVALLCLPEHFDRSWDDVASRALGLGYANCGVEEKFDYLVRSLLAIRPFEIKMHRGMARYLALQGIERVTLELPSQHVFMRRLHQP